MQPKPEANNPQRESALPSATLLGVRQWAFEQALKMKEGCEIAADVIYRAAEIEAYIAEGKNPRDDFMVCVDAAMAELDHAGIPEVSDSSKRKTLVVVRKWLKEYDALY
jgi:hypothetical protein